MQTTEIKINANEAEYLAEKLRMFRHEPEALLLLTRVLAAKTRITVTIEHRAAEDESHSYSILRDPYHRMLEI